MKFRIEEFSVKNYRSISQLAVRSTSNNLITICGANNVGKTNFLRALKLFFCASVDEFEPNDDIPYHIVEGTMGGGYKTTLKAKLRDIENDDVYSLTQVYSKRQKEKLLEIKGTKNKETLTEKEVLDLLEKQFSFFLVEASNIDIPKVISEIVKDDILPAGLVRNRGTQKDALEVLVDFIDKSKVAVGRIENELTALFKPLFANIDSIQAETWKLKINFPEYNFLRDAISSMIKFTLFDSNEKELESKGSGIQRIILLSLIQYLNKKSRKNIVWAIDEPEAFLQPSLQKNLYSQFVSESSKNTIIIATHSTFFIDLNNLDNTILFEGTKEQKDYSRAKDKVFYKINVVADSTLSPFEKAQKIKSHFGIIKNDSWEIMPYNILVEGQEDKDYLISLMNLFNLEIPNILVAGGVPKYAGYLQFLDDYCSELKSKPKIFAIYDKDSAGRQEYNSLNSDSKRRKLKHIDLTNSYVTRFDGKQYDDIEIEDLIPTATISDAVNKILKKQGFASIKVSDKSKRTLPVYDKKPILEFISEMVRQNNTDKHPLPFDTIEMKLKLSVLICKAINNDARTQQEIKKHSKIKEFIEKVVGK